MTSLRSQAGFTIIKLGRTDVSVPFLVPHHVPFQLHSQTMISLNSGGQNITFDTLVCSYLCWIAFSIMTITLLAEPLESELAVQVEYDMDEQG